MIKNRGSYLTSFEVAIMLNLSPDYIRKLIRRKKIKGEKLGTIWLIPKQSFKSIIRTRFKNKEIEDERVSE